MDMMEVLSVLFRWLHVGAGVLWIGLLYWFNFVNTPFASTMDGDTKKKVVPELIPRSLYFFRWGAAYTWITGVLLLLLVFYHGGLMFDEGAEQWTAGSFVMLAIVFLIYPVYDVIAKTEMAKNLKVFGVLAFVVIGIIIVAMIEIGNFSYRGYVIHLGVMFGTLMAANVWMRIWPLQKKIITAVKEGTAPDAALVALAGQRSRHNVYMSVPLLWTMVNMHTTVPAADHWAYLLGVIIIGWLTVTWMYKKAGQVKGF